VPVARPGRAHDIRLTSVPCTGDEFARHDAIVVSTAHSDFRRPELFSRARLVIDTRNLLPPLGLGAGAAGPEVVRA
jgi:UDP-N-acetyl-D-mannosaminuronate dehydrogenase